MSIKNIHFDVPKAPLVELPLAVITVGGIDDVTVTLNGTDFPATEPDAPWSRARFGELLELSGAGFIPGEDITVALTISSVESNTHSEARALIDLAQLAEFLCPKLERGVCQTLKRRLLAQPPAQTIPQLQAQLTQFQQLYNTYRPHRALHGATPDHAYNATPKGFPP